MSDQEQRVQGQQRCAASVHNGYGVGFHQCENTGKHSEDGKWWCGIHRPSKVAARRRKADEKHSAEFRAKQEKRERQRACVSACKGIPDPEQAISKAREVLQEIVGTIEGGGRFVTFSDADVARYTETLALLGNQ